jgi:uncharacterized membrane protein YphA (DoxX/SURF4 family)
VAPIVSGLDKFFNVLAYWKDYLAPWIDRIMPGTAQEFMYFVGYFVGAVEVAAGIVVLISPK